jgi:UDP-N-acetylglucosamine 2-epimerase
VLRPRVLVTYAEAGGWGRALVLEARRRGIPTVGIQHGFISRHWLNYLHEDDEIAPSPGNPADRGCPLPDLTLLYDEIARQHLLTAGRYPATRLRVTGNPRLEALVAAARALPDDEIARTRRDTGARDDQHLVLLAAKRIPEFDATFLALVQAVAGMPDVHLAIRPHPAETAEPYLALARGVANVRVVPLSLSPVALMRAARLVVTINSTVAIEAMALDVPALAMRLPNYLSPFVDAGAMAGTTRLDEIGPAVVRLVRDEAARRRLAAGRRAFLGADRRDADGQAAARAAGAILELAT